jgi:hypothetical protein
MTILALARAISPLIGKDVARIYTRRKQAAICWFCKFFPLILTIKPASAAMLVDISALTKASKVLAPASAAKPEPLRERSQSAEQGSFIPDEFDPMFDDNTFGWGYSE